MQNADVIPELTERWNTGDIDGVLDLYAEDAVTRTGPHWPEQVSYEGRNAIRASMQEWRSIWEMILVEVTGLEEYGAKVVATGSWSMRGLASGVGGEMPIFILFTLRDGKIAALEWFANRDTAVAAAHGG
ncbi:MAG: nuclear transport factor 2 family protein [Thermoleophilaceae bacterium]|nr:nuclear transport factor 2 family protein [Thermoleophilaceae bacterium]